MAPEQIAAADRVGPLVYGIKPDTGQAMLKRFMATGRAFRRARRQTTDKE
jgi:hypothetical protein